MSNIQCAVVTVHFGNPQADQRNDRLPGSVERFFSAMANKVGPKIAPCFVAVEREGGRRHCMFDSNFGAIIGQIERTWVEFSLFRWTQRSRSSALPEATV
jgi:hypothetical protein